MGDLDFPTTDEEFDRMIAQALQNSMNEAKASEATSSNTKETAEIKDDANEKEVVAEKVKDQPLTATGTTKIDVKPGKFKLEVEVPTPPGEKNEPTEVKGPKINNFVSDVVGNMDIDDDSDENESKPEKLNLGVAASEPMKLNKLMGKVPSKH
jgi:hypothetical protein